MKIDKKIQKLLILLVLFVGILLVSSIVNAGTLSVSASPGSVTIGDTVKITISGNNLTGRFSVSFSNATLVGTAPEYWLENNSKSITLKPNSEGSVKVTITPLDMVDSVTAEDYTGGAKSTTVTVKGKEETPPPDNTTGNNTTGGNNNLAAKTLKSIVITDASTGKKIGSTITKNGVSITTPSGVGRIKVVINYSDGTSDSKTVELGDGRKKIFFGSFYINVTGSSINEADITNEGIEETENENVEADTSKKLKNLTVKGFSISPEFNPNVFTYTLQVDSNITRLDIEGLLELDTETIEIIGADDLKFGENIIEIIIKSADGEEIARYKIIVTRLEEIKEKTNVVEKNNNSEFWWTIGVVSMIILIALIGIIFAIKEYRKTKNEEDFVSEIPEYFDNNNIEENTIKKETTSKRSKAKRMK